MRKCKVLRFLLFNSLVLLTVPARLWAAFEAPEADPVPFALANVVSFRDYLTCSDSPAGNWFLTVGGARLFGMPEIQPFGFSAGGQVMGGQMRLKGGGLKSGTYRETSSALAYERKFQGSVTAGLEFQLLQVSIKDYGTAWSQQLNAHLEWSLQSNFRLAFTWINLTNSHFGQDDYPLPQRLALGGMLSAFRNVELFLELEQDTRHSLSPRFGLGFSPLERITLLAGFQGEPNIVSAGVSGLIGSVRATAAYQYHPDLGFSQCYGMAVVF